MEISFPQDGYVRRTFAFFFFSLFFISCTDIHASVPDPLPPAAYSWKADLEFLNFNPSQEEKVLKAVSLIKKVISSPEFRERILNHKYEGKPGFVDSNGLTNEQIYEKILSGAEIMGNTDKNNTMNVEIELYTDKTTTIGYTYPTTGRIWMNTKYFNTYTPVKVADNLMHEWMHKLGFTHAMKYSVSRNYSVPYAIGYLVEELAAKYQ